MKTILLLSLWLVCQGIVVAQTSTTLIANGESWRYSDKGTQPSDQTPAAITYTWKDLGYDDSSPVSWSAGPSELGYGDGDEATTVSDGGNAANRFITTYFRKTITDAGVLTRYRYKMRYKRDDGIVIYVNGTEVRRDGMPGGTITNSTVATLLVGGIDESTFYEFYLPNGTLRPDNNVVAAEVHQIGPTSSDITFTLELIAESYSNVLAPAPLPVLSVAATNWKYYDAGSNLGTTWQTIGYDDSFWQQTNIGSVARNRMGYGETTDPNANTINTAISNPYNADPYTNYISYGLVPTAKFPTTYFRKEINIPNVAANTYELRFMRDDGILIHVNGTELPRNVNGNTQNMPVGPASFTTLATTDATNETAWLAWQPVSASLLQNGDNILAVEVHQASVGSSDITFNLEMRAVGVATVTRGPYLQMGTQTGATIRWRTNVPTVGKVSYGLSVSSLTGSVTEPASTTEHILSLTGLTPDSQYFYSIGTPTQVLQQGPDNYFLTAPPANTTRKIRVVAFGDCGNNVVANNQAKVRDTFTSFRGNTPTDLWTLIGDNSYDGNDADYQTNFFEAYQGGLMKNSMLFPIPGNHDYYTFPTQTPIPYLSIFSLPANAEVGGVASGTEEWYSFDYGPIHFVMLDGYGTKNVGGIQKKFYDDTVSHPQVIWLRQDLQANTKKWTVAYLHFPPYSQGSHNSETETDLIAIRQKINPIFERFGVDMVLTGHSHVYERSFPIHDQYGPMADFVSSPSAYRFPEDNTTGRYDGSPNSCLYKNTSEKKKQGTVYVVSGSAGALEHNAALGDHPVMVATQKLVGGSFYFEVEDNRLDAKFIQANSTTSYSIADQFTIMKNVGLTQSLTVSAGQSVTLTTSFISTYQWSNPANVTFTAATRSVVVTPGSSSTYVVRDSQQCVQDVFTVQVCSASSLYTVKTGSWTDPTVWSCNRIPTLTDTVALKHLVSVPAGVVAHALRVTYDPGINLQFGSNARLQLGL